ncbi:MAG: CpXC domain-containing protein [Clostridia bacterium]|nr:CpXC domain-containing protein [Clostridia bacterium]
MRSERRPMTCRHCGKEFTARVILQVDYGRPEDREANLTDGSLFAYRCPHCGEEMHFNHYLLWVDEGHTVAVCNITCEEEKKAVDEALSALVAFGKDSRIRRRFVSSPARLCEKAQIFSQGLDDRTVEVIKLYMAEEVRRAHPQKTVTDALFFPDNEDFGILFLCPDGNLSVKVTREQFDAVCSRFAFSEPSPEVVDGAWAIAYLTGGKSC